jgi:Kdo2-lipid IVA lauroyltransferase/acyltransferase
MSQGTPDPARQGSLPSRLGVAFMAALSHLPLPVVRGLGWVLGHALYALAVGRRRVALVNWGLCFPQDTPAQRRRAVRTHFVQFAQAWLDRSWLWEAPASVVRQRLRLTGHVDALAGTAPTVVFAPHFVGMDAGWIGLTLLQPRRCAGIYAPQANVAVDTWMARGRQRFGDPLVVAKWQGLKPLAAALREGMPLYLLPDMDHGLADSVWAPFFGTPVATLSSLPRFARLGRARVVPVISRMTATGYDVEVLPPWGHYPTDDVSADAARMNRELEALIATMPTQYYWVHKRFKTRPEGQPSVYR